MINRFDPNQGKIKNCIVIIPLPPKITKQRLQSISQDYPTRAWELVNTEEDSMDGSMWMYSEKEGYTHIVIINSKQLSKSIFDQVHKIATDKRLTSGSKILIDLRIIEDIKQTEKLDLFVTDLAAALKVGLQPMTLFKSEQKKAPKFPDILFRTNSEGNKIKGWIQNGLFFGETINSIRTLVNLPSNKKSPIEMEEWLVSSGQKNGYSTEIKEKSALEKEGFHALLAVNRGSEIPAKCLIAEYKPKKKGNLTKIVLVGKGVTFDTGGLSIKGSQNMHYMKSDMGGAAAVMGTIEMASKLKLPVHLIVIVPTTDNSVDAKSIKPGDVIDSFSGKTIEVIDTDAEGRLILADALSFSIQQYNPDFVIDLATLTGSVVRALGTEAAGYMTNNNDLAVSLEKAAERSGEKIWRLPLWDDYNEYLKSDIADIRNLGSKPMAGAITAAKFLESFTHNHKAWGHLDIAGTAFGQYPGSKGYAATGYGVRLLIEWIKTIIKNEG